MSNARKPAWYSSIFRRESQGESQFDSVEMTALPSQSCLATSNAVTEENPPAPTSIAANPTSFESSATGPMFPEHYTWDSGMRDFSQVTHRSQQHKSIPQAPPGLPQGKDSGTTQLGLRIGLCEQWIRDLRNRRRYLKTLILKDGNKPEYEEEIEAIAEETQKWAEWRAELRANVWRAK